MRPTKDGATLAREMRDACTAGDHPWWDWREENIEGAEEALILANYVRRLELDIAEVNRVCKAWDENESSKDCMEQIFNRSIGESE